MFELSDPHPRSSSPIPSTRPGTQPQPHDHGQDQAQAQAQDQGQPKSKKGLKGAFRRASGRVLGLFSGSGSGSGGEPADGAKAGSSGRSSWGRSRSRPTSASASDQKNAQGSTEGAGLTSASIPAVPAASPAVALVAVLEAALAEAQREAEAQCARQTMQLPASEAPTSQHNSDVHRALLDLIAATAVAEDQVQAQAQALALAQGFDGMNAALPISAIATPNAHGSAEAPSSLAPRAIQLLAMRLDHSTRTVLDLSSALHSMTANHIESVGRLTGQLSEVVGQLNAAGDPSYAYAVPNSYSLVSGRAGGGSYSSGYSGGYNVGYSGGDGSSSSSNGSLSGSQRVPAHSRSLSGGHLEAMSASGVIPSADAGNAEAGEAMDLGEMVAHLSRSAETAEEAARASEEKVKCRFVVRRLYCAFNAHPLANPFFSLYLTLDPHAQATMLQEEMDALVVETDWVRQRNHRLAAEAVATQRQHEDELRKALVRCEQLEERLAEVDRGAGQREREIEQRERRMERMIGALREAGVSLDLAL